MSPARAILEMSATDLVAGEDPSCRWTVTNEGPQPLDVPDLDENADWPQLIVEDLGSGVTQPADRAAIQAELRVRPATLRPDLGATIRLSPGETRTWVFQLSHQVRLPLPGRYRLHGWFAAEGLEHRSNAVILEIRASSVARSDLTYAHSGFADTFYETWACHDRPALYLRALRVRGQARQLHCRHIASLTAPVEPLVSVTRNRATAESRCIVWLQGNAVCAVDVGPAGITRPQRALPLPGQLRLIVPRPWHEPESDDTLALVWLEQQDEAMLVPVAIQADHLEVRPAATVRMPQPLWARSFFKSNGERLGFFLAARGGCMALHYLHYGEELVVATTPMATWEWDLMGIAAHLGPDDTIRGVVVGQQRGDGPEAAPLFAAWSLDQDMRFAADSPQAWPGLEPHAIEHFQVAVDSQGTAFALVQSPDGRWTCLTPGYEHPVAAPLGADAPVLRFMAGGTVPLVLWRDPSRGLVVTPVGGELTDVDGPVLLASPFAEQRS